MVDSYVECLVSCKRNMGAFVLRTFIYTLCGICLLGALLSGIAVLFIAGIAFAAVGYFLCPSPDIEYEYLYLDKELSIDKIISKQKRKKAGSFDLTKMEKMCPFNSHELDSYKSRNLPIKDFTSKDPEKKAYVIVCREDKGEVLVKIEPNEELLTAIKNSFPRKVIEY